MTRVQKMIISESEAGQRIDNFLMRKFKDLPRSKIYKIIRKGEVRVSGCRKQPSYKIKTNDELVLQLVPKKRDELTPTPSVLDTVEEKSEDTPAIPDNNN